MVHHPLVDLGWQHRLLRSELLRAIERVLDGGRYILGAEVARLEEEMAARCGVEHAVGVASGTDALLLLLRAFDIGAGDEVITAPFSFFATAEAIVQAGARPVFADVDPRTFLLDAEAVDRSVTPATKAILAVHLFGQMADMSRLRGIAHAHGIHLFEDACQAIGARWREHPVGALGDGAAVSFFPTKNLGGCGDGGMVLLHDARRAARIRRLRAHGSARRYEHQEVGCNSRLDELQAAILRVKLGRLDEWTGLRRAIASRYDQALRDLPLSVPFHPGEAYHVYHLYTLVTERREGLRQALAADGIGCGVYYPAPLHLQAALRHLGYRPGAFPAAERLCREVLSIPLYPGLSEAAQACVIERIRRFHGAAPRPAGAPRP